MAGFTDSALEKKLLELNGSQQSIQTLSLWLIHHRKHHKTIVKVWFKELKKAKPSRKLTFMYLANDVIQNSKKKGPEFSKEFSTILSKAFSHVYGSISDDKLKSGLLRIIKVWEDRNVYDAKIIGDLRDSVDGDVKPTPSPIQISKPSPVREKKRPASISRSAKPEKSKGRPPEKKLKTVDIKKKIIVKEEIEDIVISPPIEPPDADKLIRALQDLENSPSTDAVVREKIANLPPEVSDITLLEKVQNLDSAKKLAKQVDEACVMLTDYNSRLTEELQNRKFVSKMLSDFTCAQRDLIAGAEKKIDEFKSKLKRVCQVRNELKSHLQNLPDLTLLPSVTGGLAPLPSAGDLFNQP